MPAPVRGVLFDVDGTLVDSGYQHALAWWQSLRRQDVDVPISTIHRAIGMGSDKLIPHVLDEAGVNADTVDLNEVEAGHSAVYATHWPELRLLPGARLLVQRCAAAGLTTVLASSASPDELSVLRRLLDLDEMLDVVTGGGDADQSKPDPELVRVALERAGLAAEDAVFVGDAVWDVHAATDAGVRCIGLECGGTSAAELREAGAVATYSHPAELVGRWDDSILNAGIPNQTEDDA